MNKVFTAFFKLKLRYLPTLYMPFLKNYSCIFFRVNDSVHERYKSDFHKILKFTNAFVAFRDLSLFMSIFQK